MNQITKEALEFLEEAKEAFCKDDTSATYTNVKKGFIALRVGFREDCISIYEIDREVGNFTEQLPKQQKIVVDYDEYNKLKSENEKYKAIFANIGIDPTCTE